VLSDVLSGKRIVICAGPGGVGKTTTSAAVAAGLAARGQRVAVLTIDPARRLADALGLDALDDTARPVNANLFALMLDSKRTFDSLIDRVAPSPEARDEVLANPIYRQLSSAVAGTQEFTAIAKLYELDAAGEYDVLVLDTPPSRNALDFLDAPDRLTGFLQGRAIRLFLRPGRLLGAGTGVVFHALRRATGVALLDDLSTFFRALGTMLPDLAERGAHVKALLSSPATVFLLVTSLEREPVDETIFFHARLREARMPFGAVVVNKLRDPVAEGGPLDLPDALAAKVEAGAAEAEQLAARDAAGLDRLREALEDPAVIGVPQLPGDVHDLDGLTRMGEHLFTSRPRAGA
jgi:anion-transporting  ArsA/GET3 family ATPase